MRATGDHDARLMRGRKRHMLPKKRAPREQMT